MSCPIRITQPFKNPPRVKTPDGDGTATHRIPVCHSVLYRVRLDDGQVKDFPLSVINF